MLVMLVVAAVYFYFNWQYFRLVRELRTESCKGVWLVVFSFVVNYLFFCFCSFKECHLIFNWSCFAVLLWLETLIYNRGDRRSALFCTLLGIIYGLAVNIFCRSVIAILMNQPLHSFDNHIKEIDNLKAIPVFWGFFLTGITLQCLRRPISSKRLRLIVERPQHQTFLLQIMFGFFVYLCLNLLLYSTPMNSLLIKIWSIKSSFFCLGGLYIAIWYTRRVCELDDYRWKNKEMEKKLRVWHQEEEDLRREASLDVLTGFYNRKYADEKIAMEMAQNRKFTVCFLDLDGLKRVNDKFGHEEGDRYILTVSEQIRRVCRPGKDLIFRYGGDEFLILFSEMTAGEAQKQAAAVNDGLRALMAGKSFNYPLAFSYGLAESAAYTEGRDLINAADEEMYRQKRQKQAGPAPAVEPVRSHVSKQEVHG